LVIRHSRFVIASLKKQRRDEHSIRTEILNMTALSSHVSNGLA